MDFGETGKKRNHPDGQNSSLSKRLFTLAEVELDSSIHYDSGTVTCLGSLAKVQDELSWRKGGWTNSATSVHSSSASELSSISAGVTTEHSCKGHIRSFHEGKGNGSWLNKHGSSGWIRCDAAQVSEVTVQRTQSVDSPVESADYEPSGESGFSIVRCRNSRRNINWEDWKIPVREKHERRHKLNDVHEQRPLSRGQTENSDIRWGATYKRVKPCSSVADETGSSCEEPTEELFLEKRRLTYADAEANRPSSIPGIESEFQSSVFPAPKRRLSPFLHTTEGGTTMSGILCDNIFEIRSAESSEAAVLNGLTTDGERGIDRGYTGGEDCSLGLSHTSCPSYVLSSGRLSLEEETRLGRRAPTIDHDFEEYFSALML